MRSPAREGGGPVWSGRGKQTSRGGALTRCNVRRTGPVRTSKESESAKGAQTGMLKEGRGQDLQSGAAESVQDHHHCCCLQFSEKMWICGALGWSLQRKGRRQYPLAVMLMVDDHSSRSFPRIGLVGQVAKTTSFGELVSS